MSFQMQKIHGGVLKAYMEVRLHVQIRLVDVLGNFIQSETKSTGPIFYIVL